MFSIDTRSVTKVGTHSGRDPGPRTCVLFLPETLPCRGDDTDVRTQCYSPERKDVGPPAPVSPWGKISPPETTKTESSRKFTLCHKITCS